MVEGIYSLIGLLEAPGISQGFCSGLVSVLMSS